MKIILITFVTPASENIRGTSALPYHLIKGMRTGVINDNVNENVNGFREAPEHLLERKSVNDNGTQISQISQNENFIIYTFNNNGLSDEKIAEVEKELGVTIKIIPLPKWYQWMFKFHLLFLRIFLKYPFINYITLPQSYVDEIKAKEPDMIWVMGEELSRVIKQFPNQQRIQIGPDTESLYYYRMMGRRFVMNRPLSYWKDALMYRKYARMEQEFCTDESFIYYAVGEEDVRNLQQLNPKVQAKFLRHPHYEVNVVMNDNVNDNRKFHEPKIKLLIAGQYNLYMKQEADLLVEQICNENGNEKINDNENTNYLKEHYEFTFLGKGWEKHVGALRGAGYEVNHIKFAPNYIEEICKHDIQITPISIGTGTKGKVLDALANGLLVIGTPYALENIAVKHGESCIEYRQPSEVITWLHEIAKDPKRFEEMARAGQQQVQTQHNPTRVSSQLFKIKKKL